MKFIAGAAALAGRGLDSSVMQCEWGLALIHYARHDPGLAKEKINST